MSELELGLKEVGLLDTVLSLCSAAGMSLGDYIQQLVSEKKEALEAASEDAKRQQLYDYLMLNVPLDYGAVRADMRKNGIDPDEGFWEERELCDL